jgi:hypothetical protein
MPAVAQGRKETYLRKKRRPRLAESFFMTAHDLSTSASCSSLKTTAPLFPSASAMPPVVVVVLLIGLVVLAWLESCVDYLM